jgi:FHA domain
MPEPWTERQQLIQRLQTAYGAGLLSDKTFAHRLDALLGSPLIDPRRFVGDLHLRRARPWFSGLRTRLWRLALRSSRLEILALDWNGAEDDLLIGRHLDCDVRLPSANVSRMHARLSFRNGRWIVRDLESTNGTVLNGVRIGRSELRPGDELVIGSHRLRVD